MPSERSVVAHVCRRSWNRTSVRTPARLHAALYRLSGLRRPFRTHPKPSEPGDDQGEQESPEAYFERVTEEVDQGVRPREAGIDFTADDRIRYGDRRRHDEAWQRAKADDGD